MGNTTPTESNPTHKRVFISLTNLILFSCVICALSTCLFWEFAVARPHQATEQYYAGLTSEHGHEVWRVLENLERRSHSSEMYDNPTLLEELYTDPVLSGIQESYEWRAANEIHLDPLELSGIRVLEYTPEQFRVLACFDHQLDDGRKATHLFQFVFVCQDEHWKVEATLNMFHPDDVRRTFYSGPDWVEEYFTGWTSFSFRDCIDDF